MLTKGKQIKAITFTEMYLKELYCSQMYQYIVPGKREENLLEVGCSEHRAAWL